MDVLYAKCRIIKINNKIVRILVLLNHSMESNALNHTVKNWQHNNKNH